MGQSNARALGIPGRDDHRLMQPWGPIAIPSTSIRCRFAIPRHLSLSRAPLEPRERLIESTSPRKRNKKIWRRSAKRHPDELKAIYHIDIVTSLTLAHNRSHLRRTIANV